MNRFMSRMMLIAAATAAASCVAQSSVLADTVVYTNSFEGGIVGTTGGGVTSSGFTTAGTLSGKTLTNTGLSLHAPMGSVGGFSDNSQWLGMYNSGSSGAAVALGRNVSKVVGSAGGTDATRNEVVRLSLNNLTVGDTYSIRFDLLVGESWDGAAASFGGDAWMFSVDGSRLVDTIFSNVSNGAFGDPSPNAGAYSPQRYTDATYTSPLGPAVNRFTGADAYYTSSTYADVFAIYRFGRGPGNPLLNFTATGTNATLEWARYSGTTDSSDESWALDNLMVTDTTPVAAAPTPGAATAGTVLLGVVAAARWRRRRAAV